MTKHDVNHKPKGLTVEGFWRQLKDKTTKDDGGPNAIESPELSELNMNSSDLPKPNDDSNDDWEARFNAWLDKP